MLLTTLTFQSDRPRNICIEPWGEIVSLEPGRQLHIIAKNETNQPWFSIVENADNISIYLEASNDFEIKEIA